VHSPGNNLSPQHGYYSAHAIILGVLDINFTADDMMHISVIPYVWGTSRLNMLHVGVEFFLGVEGEVGDYIMFMK